MENEDACEGRRETDGWMDLSVGASALDVGKREMAKVRPCEERNGGEIRL